MLKYKLDYPIFTFDNKVLFDGGTLLTDETLETYLSENKVTFPTNSLIEYKDVKQDLLKFLNRPPYHIIFSDPQLETDFLNIVEDVHLPIPVLETLYFFKHHDFYTYSHILMVFALSTLLAKKMIKDHEDLIHEVTAGPTHDIGKICVPLTILKKEESLTENELQMLRHHTLAGYVLLSYYFQDSQNFAARVARDHHERNDGSGYPSGISLNDPMIDIILVCDMYDALISPRPYRPMSYENRMAIEEITHQANSGKVNINTVKALVALNRAHEGNYKDCILSEEKRGTPPSENVYGQTTKD